MTSLARIDDLAGLGLDAIESRITDAEARGAQAFRELAALVAEVYGRELWRDAGHGNFVEWCEARGRKKSWGYQLVEAAKFSAVAENEHQARELAKAERERIKAMGAEAAVAEAKQAARRDRGALRALEAAVAVRKIGKALRKCLALCGNADVPDWFEQHLQECADYCRDQDAAEAA